MQVLVEALECSTDANAEQACIDAVESFHRPVFSEALQVVGEHCRNADRELKEAVVGVVSCGIDLKHLAFLLHGQSCYITEASFLNSRRQVALK